MPSMDETLNLFIEARKHKPSGLLSPHDICEECDEWWPCVVKRLLDWIEEVVPMGPLTAE
jgi:hypothetical protein